MFRRYVLITVLFVSCSLCFSQPVLNFNYSFAETNLRYPQLVSAFYKLNNQQNFRFNNQRSGSLKQFFLKNIIDSAALWWLNANDYHQQTLKQLVEENFAETDSVNIKQADIFFY